METAVSNAHSMIAASLGASNVKTESAMMDTPYRLGRWPAVVTSRKTRFTLLFYIALSI